MLVDFREMPNTSSVFDTESLSKTKYFESKSEIITNMDIPAFEELFQKIKLNFWLLGIPYDSKIQLRFAFFIVSICFMIVEEASFLVSRIAPENLLELTQIAPCLCCGVLSVLKILPIAFYRHKIFSLTNNLNGLYNTILADRKKKAIVKKELVLVKILIDYFYILNIILISVYNYSSLVYMLYKYIKTNTVVFSLPYDVIVPFSTETWPTWLIVYLHSTLCGFVCILLYMAVDSLYCVLTSLICKNFAIISNEIKSLDETNVNLLKDLVMKHQYVLKLSNDLEDIFKLPNLFNVLVGSLEICALGVNITMGDWAHIPGCILFLVSVLLQILMMSVFGENLIGESKKVGDAAFSCKWYDMDAKSKKTILILITRSQKAQKLTAYKFSVICYGSFTKIISTSWSYFTILRTVYTPMESVPSG